MWQLLCLAVPAGALTLALANTAPKRTALQAKAAARFRGKKVWVTGASSGVGEAVALELAKCGAGLVLTARREGALRDLEKRCLAAGAASAEVAPHSRHSRADAAAAVSCSSA